MFFVGSGATGAINKLVDILNLRLPLDLDARYHLANQIPREERPVVFHGPYEHHSNILPWRHSIADVVVIPLSDKGGLETAYLEKALIEYKDRPLRIGSFSAASNATGIATDVKAVASLLHEYGALSFWDYAAAGPYVHVEMTPKGSDVDLSYKDAVFVSPLKFIGGPGSPGVLCVREDIVRNTVPTQPGGRTVDFVTGAWLPRKAGAPGCAANDRTGGVCSCVPYYGLVDAGSWPLATADDGPGGGSNRSCAQGDHRLDGDLGLGRATGHHVREGLRLP